MSFRKCSNASPDKNYREGDRLIAETRPLLASSEVKDKERLQKLVFPDGIIYGKENGSFRTERVNSAFELMASLAWVTAEKQRDKLVLKPVCPFLRTEADRFRTISKRI